MKHWYYKSSLLKICWRGSNRLIDGPYSVCIPALEWWSYFSVWKTPDVTSFFQCDKVYSILFLALHYVSNSTCNFACPNQKSFAILICARALNSEPLLRHLDNSLHEFQFCSVSVVWRHLFYCYKGCSVWILVLTALSRLLDLDVIRMSFLLRAVYSSKLALDDKFHLSSFLWSGTMIFCYILVIFDSYGRFVLHVLFTFISTSLVLQHLRTSERPLSSLIPLILKSHAVTTLCILQMSCNYLSSHEAQGAMVSIQLRLTCVLMELSAPICVKFSFSFKSKVLPLPALFTCHCSAFFYMMKKLISEIHSNST